MYPCVRLLLIQSGRGGSFGVPRKQTPLLIYRTPNYLIFWLSTRATHCIAGKGKSNYWCWWYSPKSRIILSIQIGSWNNNNYTKKQTNDLPRGAFRSKFWQPSRAPPDQSFTELILLSELGTFISINNCQRLPFSPWSRINFLNRSLVRSTYS
jgi:hypothetical protein